MQKILAKLGVQAIGAICAWKGRRILAIVHVQVQLGVIDDILIPDLPPMFYIAPLLHVQMSLVNKALDVLQDFVEKYVEA